MTTDTETLDHVRKNFKVRWYRCPIERSVLLELMQPNDMKGWFQTLGHLALFAATGALSYYFFERESWVGFAIALYAHGTVASHFIFACHELGHGTVFRAKWLNAFFLRVFSLLGWWSFHEYGMSHYHHHVYTCHPRGDLEVTLPAEPSLRLHYLVQLFTLNLFGGYMTRGFISWPWALIKTAVGGYSVLSTPGWLEALYADKPEARRYAVNWARFLLFFHIGATIVCFAFGLWIIPVLLSLAPYLANWHAYFVAVPMHAGLRDDVPDFRLSVRTITLPPLSEFLYWRMNWHLEHHMFAAVPCYNLKKLHHAVARDMPKPRSLIGSWIEMRRAWVKQKDDPAYAYDTPLPATAESAAAEQEPEASSVGDIAPRGLRSEEEKRERVSREPDETEAEA